MRKSSGVLLFAVILTTALFVGSAAGMPIVFVYQNNTGLSGTYYAGSNSITFYNGVLTGDNIVEGTYTGADDSQKIFVKYPTAEVRMSLSNYPAASVIGSKVSPDSLVDVTTLLINSISDVGLIFTTPSGIQTTAFGKTLAGDSINWQHQNSASNVDLSDMTHGTWKVQGYFNIGDYGLAAGTPEKYRLGRDVYSFTIEHIESGISIDTGRKDETVPAVLNLQAGWNVLSVTGVLSPSADTGAELFNTVKTDGRAMLLYDAKTQSWKTTDANTALSKGEVCAIYTTTAVSIPLGETTPAIVPMNASVAPIPAQFYGTAVTASGQPLPAGTEIKAEINGNPAASYTLEKAGEIGTVGMFGEKFLVAGNGTVQFKAGNMYASQTAKAVSGEVEQISLTFFEPTPTPTIPPTTEPSKSPVPVVGILAGLAAVLLLRKTN